MISLLWVLGTAGASDLDRISLGQCTMRLIIGAVGLYISARLINEKGGDQIE